MTTAACSASTAEPSSPGHIGIKLLDAPVSRRDDPRANAYIIDHLPPGSVIHRRVEIRNNTETRQTIEVYAAAAEIRDARFAAAEGRTLNELSTWVSFDRPNVVVPAWGRTSVTATITVPPTGTGGEQYAVVWAEVSAPPSPTKSVGLVSRVGVRVYLDIGPGSEPPSGFEIGQVTAGRSADGQPEFRAQVHNTGGRAVDISGELSLADGPGKLSAGPFKVTVGTTLAPGNSAPVSVLLDRQLPNGPWTSTLTLDSGLLHRTVRATITFPDEAGNGGSVVIIHDWTFLGMSARTLIILGAIAAALAALAAAAVVIRRRRSTRPLAQV